MLLFYISSQAVIATGCFILGFHILLMDRRSHVNRLFFINSMLLNLVIIFTILIQLTDTAVSVKIIQSIYNIVLITFLLESLYFNLVFCGRSLYRPVRILLIILTSTVFVFFIIKGQSLLYVTKFQEFWVYGLCNYPFWFLLYSPLIALIVILMLHSLYRFSRGASLNREKSQAGIMMLSIFASCSAGFIFLMVLPLFSIYRAPLLTPYFFAVYLCGVFFAMTRYRFMVFGIKDVAQNALLYISDMVIILGQDYRIMDMNSSAAFMLSTSAHDAKGMYFPGMTSNYETVKNLLDTASAGRGPVKGRIAYICNGEKVLSDSTITAVRDRFGDLSTLLIVSQESRGTEQFRKYFKLTGREMEIILHTISGKTNKEIASMLDITKRTVETHQNNIYNKLGISNKIELLNVTSDFGIKTV